MKAIKSKFLKVYLIIVSTMLVLLLAAAIVLWQFLSAYEMTRAKHIAQDIFNNYFQTANIEAFIDEANVVGSEFTDNKLLADEMEKLISGAKLDYFSVSSNKKGVEKFAVTADGERIAYFSVITTEEPYKFGLNKCELESAELFAKSTKKIKITVPSDYVPTINGKSVGNRYITKQGIDHHNNQFLPDEVTGIKMTEYTVEGLFDKESTVTAVAPNGQAAEITGNINSGFTAALSSDQALEAEFADYAIDFTSAYAAVMSDDIPKSRVYPYIDKNSEFYQKIRSSEVNWVWDHNGYKITDKKASQFYKYSDDVFSCRVKATQTLFLGNRTHVEYIDLIVFFHKQNDKYLVFNAITNG